MIQIPGTILQEPDLLFGRERADKDPRTGLDRHGPYHPESEVGPTPAHIRVGIVATAEGATITKRLLKKIGEPVASVNSNKWLSPDFPGFSQGTSIACDFVAGDQWIGRLTDSDIRALEQFTNVNERIAACANLYVDRIRQLKGEEPPPDVIICVLPKWVEEYCGRSKFTRGASIPKPTKAEISRRENHSLNEWLELPEAEVVEKDYDLHNAMKGKAMKQGIPIQILRETSAAALVKKLDGDDVDFGPLGLQAPSEFAWNFATALYYKANGRPWRLAKLTPGTCYVGISFFRNKRSATGELQFSMAQVFTHSLQGFVIRGTEVTVDARTREAFMSERQAFELLKHAIDKYVEKARTKPARVVVHKTSRFSEEERKGVLKAIGECPRDLASFRSSPIRFLRQGEYPVLRGTVLSLSRREHLLYTRGYIPRIRTYPGARVPEPLLITHDGDGEFDLVCREILGLSKLDWNTTAFATSKPITISFAQSVGEVLSELADDETVQDHYRFYM